jgi:hypothetical protein
MIKIRQLSGLIDPLQSSTNLNHEFLKCPFYNLQHSSWSAEWTVSLNNYNTYANDPADLIHVHLASCSMITVVQSGEGTTLEILITELYSNSCTSTPFITYKCRCTSIHTLRELDP